MDGRVFLYFICLGIYFGHTEPSQLCPGPLPSCRAGPPLQSRPPGAAALVAEPGPWACGLSRCAARAWLLRGRWNLPRPGVKPMCPALAVDVTHCTTREVLGGRIHNENTGLVRSVRWFLLFSSWQLPSSLLYSCLSSLRS